MWSWKRAFQRFFVSGITHLNVSMGGSVLLLFPPHSSFNIANSFIYSYIHPSRSISTFEYIFPNGQFHAVPANGTSKAVM